jgi:uncharacterized HAD superfamily protein
MTRTIDVNDIPGLSLHQKLGVDIDNVISLTDPALRESIWDLFGIRLEQEQVCYYEYARCGLTKEQELRLLETFREDIIEKLEVVPGAIEALEALRRCYRIILVTSRNPQLAGKTKDWLRLKNIPHDLLIFERDKHQTDHKFDFFVEDHADFAMALAQAGIRTFLFDYPWNRSLPAHPNITRVAGWGEVLDHLATMPDCHSGSGRRA